MSCIGTRRRRLLIRPQGSCGPTSGVEQGWGLSFSAKGGNVDEPKNEGIQLSIRPQFAKDASDIQFVNYFRFSCAGTDVVMDLGVLDPATVAAHPRGGCNNCQTVWNEPEWTRLTQTTGG
jgi:hypothetical protein